jgi:hypothetical protein
LLLGSIIAGAVYLAAQKNEFATGMASMLVGSLLVSHHAGPEDCILLLPAILLFGHDLADSRLVSLCLVLLSPIPYYFLVLGGWPGMAAKLTIVGLFGIIVLHATKRQSYEKVGTPAEWAHV